MSLSLSLSRSFSLLELWMYMWLLEEGLCRADEDSDDGDDAVCGLLWKKQNFGSMKRGS